MVEFWNIGRMPSQSNGGPRSVVADSYGGRDGARPSIPSFHYSHIPTFQQSYSGKIISRFSANMTVFLGPPSIVYSIVSCLIIGAMGSKASL